jgi:uncharacterized protein YijF (DUF1287 family)
LRWSSWRIGVPIVLSMATSASVSYGTGNILAWRMCCNMSRPHVTVSSNHREQTADQPGSNINAITHIGKHIHWPTNNLCIVVFHIGC